jgi:hypothetical protein
MRGYPVCTGSKCRCDGTLPSLLIVKFTTLKAAVLSGQNLIKLFDKSEKCGPVFFQRNEGAQLLNALTVGFIHMRPAAIKTFARD